MSTIGTKNLMVASLEHTIEHSTGVTEILTKSVATDGSEKESSDANASSSSEAGEPLESPSSFPEDSGRMRERIAWTKCG